MGGCLIRNTDRALTDVITRVHPARGSDLADLGTRSLAGGALRGVAVRVGFSL
jgi:hypothetical protein